MKRYNYDPEGNKARILGFIIEYKSEHDGCSPGIEEIGEAVGISSTSHISYTLNRLRDDGAIDFQDGVARSIEVIGGQWILED